MVINHAAPFEIALQRLRTSPAGTFGVIGDLTAADAFHTMEQPIVGPNGEKNLHNVTAILPGRYQLTAAWSDHFHRLILSLVDVPGRSGIEIHDGQRLADTLGCILIGGPVVGDELTYSLDAVEDFTRMVCDELIGGRLVYLTILDPPAPAAV